VNLIGREKAFVEPNRMMLSREKKERKKRKRKKTRNVGWEVEGRTKNDDERSKKKK
jgi:hypothetical protein